MQSARKMMPESGVEFMAPFSGACVRGFSFSWYLKTCHTVCTLKSASKILGKPVNGSPKFSVSSIRVGRVSRVRVTLTVTVRVSIVSVMVSVRDSVK